MVHDDVPQQTHGILVLLVRQGLLTTDELRRGVEALPGHADMSYYHRFGATHNLRLCMAMLICLTTIGLVQLTI